MMRILNNLGRSLLITGIFSFLAPVLLVMGLMATIGALGYIPGLDSLGRAGFQLLSTFLSVFGTGDAVKGILIIGAVCSSVGILFDTYTFYRYQRLS